MHSTAGTQSRQEMYRTIQGKLCLKLHTRAWICTRTYRNTHMTTETNIRKLESCIIKIKTYVLWSVREF